MIAISAPATNPPPVSAPPLTCPWVKSEGVKVAPNGEYVVQVKNLSDTEEEVLSITVYMLQPNGDKAAAIYDGNATVDPNGESLIGLPTLPATPVDGTKFGVTIDTCESPNDTGA